VLLAGGMRSLRTADYPTVRSVVIVPAGTRRRQRLHRALYRPAPGRAASATRWSVTTDRPLPASSAPSRRQGSARRLYAAARLFDGTRKSAQLFTTLPYDPIKDFAPVTEVIATRSVLILNPVGTGEKRAGADSVREG